MGMRPSATLAYGYIIDEDDIYEHCPEDQDWQNWLNNLYYETDPDDVKWHSMGYEGMDGVLFSVGKYYTNFGWETTEIPETLRVPTEDEVASLKELIKKTGLPWREPNWYLVAHYG